MAPVPVTEKEEAFGRAAAAAERAEEMYKGAWQAAVASHTMSPERTTRKEEAAREAAGKAAEAFTRAAEAARVAREEQEEMEAREAEAAGGVKQAAGTQRAAEVEQRPTPEAAEG